MMEIRKELREKLFHFYSDTFLNLETSLNNLGELDFYLWMNSSDSTFGAFLENGNNAVSLHHLPEFNLLLLTQEIFDDFGAALNCFTVGYFKQTQTLLRNTVEIAFQIGKTKYDFEHGNLSNSLWVNGIRGIEKIRDASEEISTLNDSIPEIKDKMKKLNKLYDRLCSSTHSRKDRLNIIKSPRQDSTLYGLIFDPIELLYTKRIFIYTLCLIYPSC